MSEFKVEDVAGAMDERQAAVDECGQLSRALVDLENKRNTAHKRREAATKALGEALRAKLGREQLHNLVFAIEQTKGGK